LHSIIGASVLPRSSATILAVIAAIFLSIIDWGKTKNQKKGAMKPP
jgi:hypothetical protein